MFKTRPGAPVSRIKFPSVVSTLPLITIKLPALVNGMVQVAESLVTNGSVKKRSRESGALQIEPCRGTAKIYAYESVKNNIKHVLCKDAGQFSYVKLINTVLKPCFNNAA